jgi:hypothetical protein
MKDSKDSIVGKGYSYFFAFLLVATMFLASIRVEIEFPKNKLPEIKSFSIEEIPELSAIAHLAIIAYLLGVPTDSIAIKIAQMLHPEEKDKDDQGDK